MSYTYEFNFKLDDKNLSVEVDIVNHCDPNYGADADGRRGMHQDFPEVEEIRIYDGQAQVTDQEIIRLVDEEFEQAHIGRAFDKAAEAYHETPEREHDDFN